MASRNTNRTIRPAEEMSEAIRNESLSRSAGSRTLVPNNYKAVSDSLKNDTLQSDISFRIEQLSNRVTVDLQNVSDLQDKTVQYLKACQSAGVVPSVQGLCVHGYGYSRQYVYRWMMNNSGSESARYFDVVRDSIADIVTNESMKGNLNSIMSIFILKNNHGFADSIRIEPVSDKQTEMTPEQLIAEARLLGLTDDDCDIEEDGLPI